MWFDGDDDDDTKNPLPTPDEGGPGAGQYDTEVDVPGGNNAIDNSQL